MNHEICKMEKKLLLFANSDQVIFIIWVNVPWTLAIYGKAPDLTFQKPYPAQYGQTYKSCVLHGMGKPIKAMSCTERV